MHVGTLTYISTRRDVGRRLLPTVPGRNDGGLNQGGRRWNQEDTQRKPASS